MVQFGQALVASWSRAQVSIALSSAEAEFYALAMGSVEALMAQSLLLEAGTPYLPIRLLPDSCAAQACAQRQGAYRMKQVQLRHMFVKE